jgi:hypothetical protein
MPNYFDQSINRLGQNNATGDQRALFLKVFSGEILAQYATQTVLAPLVRTRSISVGKSATFPIYGQAAAKWHTPGQNILEASNSMLSSIKYGERVIAIDNLLTSSTLIHDVDELMNHWDVRSPVATELSRALAYAFDKFAMNTLAAAANTGTDPIGRKSANGTDLIGKVITSSNTYANVTGAEMVDNLFTAQADLDNKDVPQDGRFVIVRPEVFNKILASPVGMTAGYSGSSYNLASQAQRFSKDFSNSAPDILKGTANPYLEIAGFKVFKSNLLPIASTRGDVTFTGGIASNTSGNIANDPWGTGTGYAGSAAATDMDKAVALYGHADAIGCVKKMDVTTEMERKIEYQGTLIVSKLMAGFGILRPECAGMIKCT